MFNVFAFSKDHDECVWITADKVVYNPYDQTVKVSNGFNRYIFKLNRFAKLRVVDGNGSRNCATWSKETGYACRPIIFQR